MANLKAIRKRIGSVKNTQKITRAMKLVAAAKLRKAQQNALDLRPYAERTFEVLSAVAGRASEEDREAHPLLARREPKRVLAVVLSSDRGLAGAFNVNVSKTAYRFYLEQKELGREVEFAVVGRKARDYLKRRSAPIVRESTGMVEDLSSEAAARFAREVIEAYESHNLDACHLIYNHFKSAISQEVVNETLLPITPLEVEQEEGAVEFLYEPDKATLLGTLLPMYVQVEMYRALLESIASEHGARMTAMEAATKNAGDLIRKLTLEFNRARQAAITKELMEIIGGSEAISA